MQLLCTLTSPFARKVRMFALAKGVSDRIELVPSNPLDDPDALLRINPLSKVQALVLDDGMGLYDSRVICEYLDTLTDDPVLIPRQSDQYWNLMRRQALADGLMDAAVNIVFERRRPAHEQSPSWMLRWEDKVRRALQALDAEQATLSLQRLDGIAAAAALAYLDFRLPDLDWAGHCPLLTQWWKQAAQARCVIETAPA